jgi:hypothetical protein
MKIAKLIQLLQKLPAEMEIWQKIGPSISEWSPFELQDDNVLRIYIGNFESDTDKKVLILDDGCTTYPENKNWEPLMDFIMSIGEDDIEHVFPDYVWIKSHFVNNIVKCAQCPFASTSKGLRSFEDKSPDSSPHGCWGLFFLDDINENFKEFLTEPDTPPEWCPLRKRPITLNLYKKSSHTSP